MAAWFLLLFLIVPVVELWVMIQVGGLVGAFPTVALLVAVSLFGVWLVKHEGLGVWRRLNAELQRGEVPTDSVVDGVLLLVAGVLMVVPGFVTAAVGLLLLLPPVRAVARHALVRRARHRITVSVGGFGPGVRTDLWGGNGVVDAEVIDVGDVTPPEWRDRRRGGELEGPRG